MEYTMILYVPKMVWVSQVVTGKWLKQIWHILMIVPHLIYSDNPPKFLYDTRGQHSFLSEPGRVRDYTSRPML